MKKATLVTTKSGLFKHVHLENAYADIQDNVYVVLILHTRIYRLRYTKYIDTKSLITHICRAVCIVSTNLRYTTWIIFAHNLISTTCVIQGYISLHMITDGIPGCLMHMHKTDSLTNTTLTEQVNLY